MVSQETLDRLNRIRMLSDASQRPNSAHRKSRARTASFGCPWRWSHTDHSNIPLPDAGFCSSRPCAPHHLRNRAVSLILASALVLTSVQRYKSALKSFYNAHGASAVIFEISRLSGKGGHAHIQVVPIPKSLENDVEGAFRSEGDRLGLSFEENPDEVLEYVRTTQENYFRVDFGQGKKMVHVIKPGSPFNLQFGR